MIASYKCDYGDGKTCREQVAFEYKMHQFPSKISLCKEHGELFDYYKKNGCLAGEIVNSTPLE